LIDPVIHEVLISFLARSAKTEAVVGASCRLSVIREQKG
jgi:hypothetical protein